MLKGGLIMGATTRTRNYERMYEPYDRRSINRTYQTEKGDKEDAFTKKAINQIVVCAIIFLSVYIMKSANLAFFDMLSEKVKCALVTPANFTRLSEHVREYIAANEWIQNIMHQINGYPLHTDETQTQNDPEHAANPDGAEDLSGAKSEEQPEAAEGQENQNGKDHISHAKEND
jgi:hypothetical protein